jgi:hypothetical protein
VLYSLGQIFLCRILSKTVEIKTQGKILKSFLVCGSEIRRIIDMNLNRLNTREKKILRRLCGPMVEQGV